VPLFEKDLFQEHVSWDGLCRALVRTYRAALAGCRSSDASINPLTMRPMVINATD
jgi:hypothetical protein